MANNHPVRYRCTSNEVRRQLIDAFESENIDYLELAEDLGIKREGRHDKIARGGATHIAKWISSSRLPGWLSMSLPLKSVINGFGTCKSTCQGAWTEKTSKAENSDPFLCSKLCICKNIYIELMIPTWKRESLFMTQSLFLYISIYNIYIANPEGQVSWVIYIKLNQKFLNWVHISPKRVNRNEIDCSNSLPGYCVLIWMNESWKWTHEFRKLDALTANLIAQ